MMGMKATHSLLITLAIFQCVRAEGEPAAEAEVLTTEPTAAAGEPQGEAEVLTTETTVAAIEPQGEAEVLTTETTAAAVESNKDVTAGETGKDNASGPTGKDGGGAAAPKKTVPHDLEPEIPDYEVTEDPKIHEQVAELETAQCNLIYEDCVEKKQRFYKIAKKEYLESKCLKQTQGFMICENYTKGAGKSDTEPEKNTK